MPGLERETDILETSKRNSSQTNCTVDPGFSVAGSVNVEGVPNSDIGNLNTSTTSVINKGKNNIEKLLFL